MTADFLRQNRNGITTSMERLSSGLRINSAKDDAAGLQITNRISSQINGMSVAIRNASDAISMAQTAEGAITEVNDVLFRLRDLSLLSANGSYATEDREAMQKEAGALLSELNRINDTTTFGGQRLFEDTDHVRVGDPKYSEIVGQLGTRWLSAAEKLISDQLGIDGKGTTLKIDLENYDGAGGTAAYVQSATGGTGEAINQVLVIDMDDFGEGKSTGMLELDEVILHEMTHAIQGANFEEWGNLSTWFIEGAAEAMRGADDRLSIDIANHGIAAIWNQVNTDKASNANPTGALPTAGAYSGGYVIHRYMFDELGDAGYKQINTELANGATLDAALNTASGGRWGDMNALFTELGSAAAGYANKFDEFVQTKMDLTNGDNGSLVGYDATGSGPLLDNVMANTSGSGSKSGAASFEETVVYNDDDDDNTDFGSAKYDTTLLAGIEEEAIESYGGSNDQESGYVITAQIGANSGEQMSFQLGTFSSTNLGLKDLNLVDNPQGAIFAIDNALEAVGSSQASLGATMNRLDHAISNLTNVSTNLSESRSRIQDTDMAKEAANLAKRQLLEQSSSAMLAQALQMPQMVLQLL
ncbi:flagellinolysin [Ferrimonas aestuarii]|uniref:flagellinolysin n=1 Tax=Ferrimonas aestuarii TaxID=2569539 RepID=UPI0038994245